MMRQDIGEAVVALLGRTLDALTEQQFRDLMSRPNVPEDQRNVPNPRGDS